MAHSVYRERYLRPADPRLGRHVHHDERSRLYPYRAPSSMQIRSVRHERHVPVYDQGSTGSCTGNAAVGCLGTGFFHATITDADAPWLRPLDQEAARTCYSRATAIDPFAGQWPPEDTGSDGLSVAKVLHAASAISGYQHAFRFEDAVAAVMDQPVIIGTNWYDGMFDPDDTGEVRPTGGAAGGHEYVWDGWDADGAYGWFTNSWGSSWGIAGRFRMSEATIRRLLAERGDVVVFTPASEPAPEPVLPSNDPDRRFATALRPWAFKTGMWVKDKGLRRIAQGWLRDKGL